MSTASHDITVSAASVARLIGTAVGMTSGPVEAELSYGGEAMEAARVVLERAGKYFLVVVAEVTPRDAGEPAEESSL